MLWQCKRCSYSSNKVKRFGSETNLLTADRSLNLTIKNELLCRKVVYGVDSLVERPVYAFYTENPSIHRNEQQLGRSRHPTFIKFHFKHKKYVPNPISYEEHYRKLFIMKFWRIVLSKITATKTHNCILHYLQNTNMMTFATNEQISSSGGKLYAGYKVKLSHNKIVSNTTEEDREQTKIRREEEFDVESCKRFQYLNKTLGVPLELQKNSEFS